MREYLKLEMALNYLAVMLSKVHVVGITKVYGLCGEPLDGIFETDVTEVLNRELSGDTPMDKVITILNPCAGEGKQLESAIRAFTAIYRHYRENGVYISDGGYYS